MHDVRIVEERAPYLLLARGDRFAVVERRAGRLYNLHCGRREPAPLTDEGVDAAVGETGWCDEIRARQVFCEVTSEYARLAERIW
jgi:hypothetical protein